MMVDSAYAQWLQTPARLTEKSDAAADARWGKYGQKVASTSCLSTEADAVSEAARQLAFLGGPLVEERVIVGRALPVDQLRGTCHIVTVEGDTVYRTGLTVFVLGGGVDYATGTSYLDVVRKL